MPYRCSHVTAVPNDPLAYLSFFLAVTFTGDQVMMRCQAQGENRKQLEHCLHHLTHEEC